MTDKANNILHFLIILLPPVLVTGPFLPDLIISVSSVIFLISVVYKKKTNLFDNDFVKIFLIFYFYIVIRSLFSEEILFSLKNTFFYFRFLVLALLIKYLIINKDNFLKHLMLSILLTLTIVSIDAIFEFFLGFHWLFDKSQYPEFLASNRISGLFDEEFILGGFILSLFPVILFLYFSSINVKKINLKYLSLIFCLILFIIAILISGERASFVKLILVLLFTLFFTSIIKSFKKKVIFLVSLTLIISISIFTQPKVKDRMIYQTLNLVFDTKNNKEKIGEDLSLIEFLKSKKLQNINIKYFSREHQDHATVSLKMFNDKKIFGHGVKMFRFKCAEKKYYLNKRSCSTHSHGIVLTFLSEIGLFGLSFLIISYFFIIKNILKKTDNREKIVLISIFVYLFPLLPMGYFFNNFFSLILYTLIGIYLGLKKLKKN